MTGLFDANMEKLGAATLDKEKKQKQKNILTKKTKILNVMWQVNKKTTPVRRIFKATERTHRAPAVLR